MRFFFCQNSIDFYISGYSRKRKYHCTTTTTTAAAAATTTTTSNTHQQQHQQQSHHKPQPVIARFRCPLNKRGILANCSDYQVSSRHQRRHRVLFLL